MANRKKSTTKKLPAARKKLPAARKKLRVAVLLGGLSDERAVSLASGKNILSYLDASKYLARPVRLDKDGQWQRKIKPTNTDLVFIALHGKFGEDGVIQGFLDLAGVPYTGSGVAASAIGMDKVLSKQLFLSAGIPVPRGEVLTAPDQLPQSIELPAFVKPVNGGSSVGVIPVNSMDELRNAIRDTVTKYRSALVEPKIEGRELSVPVIGNTQAQALPVIEIMPRGSSFYDYRAKYTKGGSEHVTPAKIPAPLTNAAQEIAVKCHALLGCRGYSRTDMIANSRGDIKVLEINTLPGMTVTSLTPQSAAAAGYAFSELLDRIIALALESTSHAIATTKT